MKLTLDTIEARVLGVMLEKEVTTPDAYPLSVNALTNGCNQKSSRDPVMACSEREVQAALDSLITKTIVREQGSSGGRVHRYAHRLSSRLFGELEFSAAERAVIGVLLLRGPQTAGEVRNRCARLHAFDDLADVERVLDGLARREDGPFVRMLEREPGRRESRFAHLLSGDDVPEAAPAAYAPAREDPGSRPDPNPNPGPGSVPPPERLAAAEARIEALERRLREIERRIGQVGDA